MATTVPNASLIAQPPIINTIMKEYALKEFVLGLLMAKETQVNVYQIHKRLMECMLMKLLISLLIQQLAIQRTGLYTLH